MNRDCERIVVKSGVYLSMCKYDGQGIRDTSGRSPSVVFVFTTASRDDGAMEPGEVCGERVKEQQHQWP